MWTTLAYVFVFIVILRPFFSYKYRSIRVGTYDPTDIKFKHLYHAIFGVYPHNWSSWVRKTAKPHHLLIIEGKSFFMFYKNDDGIWDLNTAGTHPDHRGKGLFTAMILKVCVLILWHRGLRCLMVTDENRFPIMFKHIMGRYCNWIGRIPDKHTRHRFQISIYMLFIYSMYANLVMFS